MKSSAASRRCSRFPERVELTWLTGGALLPYRPFKNMRSGTTQSWRLAVVVPAHNEEASISSCVRSLLNATSHGVDLTVAVIADNCADSTASVARDTGAMVLERNDPLRRGKGYALDFAFTTLRDSGFDAFLVVDADSSVAGNFVSEMARVLQAGADAVQCRYLVSNPEASTRTRLMTVAGRAFNVLRPRGRHNLGLSCSIYGNGFGMRSDVLNAVPYLADSVVEDLEYHLLLIRSGHRVVFVDNTEVYGEMPSAGKGVTTQRTRWEGGRFRMLRQRAPGLLLDVLKGRLRCLEPLLDLLLLPLAFHVTLLLISTLTPNPLIRTMGLVGLAVVLVHLITAIRVSGGGWKDFGALLSAPFYIVWKLLLIPVLVSNSRSSTKWVRTERAGEKRP